MESIVLGVAFGSGLMVAMLMEPYAPAIVSAFIAGIVIAALDYLLSKCARWCRRRRVPKREDTEALLDDPSDVQL